MGVRRAHDRGMKLIGEPEVIEETALPAQQARVLATQHRLADGKFAHDLSEPAQTSVCGRLISISTNAMGRPDAFITSCSMPAGR